MSFSSKSAVLAALIDGQRKRLLNEAAWRQEDPFSQPASEPRDVTPPPAATVQPRPEPQLNLPHLGDIWERIQQEKQSLGAINLYRMGEAVKTGINRDYINIGNYNYGVAAAAAGYTLDEAQAAAGLVNLTGHGAKSPTYYGGNPKNAGWIAKGWRDYSNGLIR